jgi:hypothetical protein|tara:strand:- start:4336 stop:4650 length:315 start_codon:yes stop_codon:yes gene_type:complete
MNLTFIYRHCKDGVQYRIRKEAITGIIKDKLDKGMSEADFIKLLSNKEEFKAFIKSEIENGVSEHATELKRCSEDVLMSGFKKCLKAMLPTGLVVAASAFEALI